MIICRGKFLVYSNLEWFRNWPLKRNGALPRILKLKRIHLCAACMADHLALNTVFDAAIRA